MQAARPTAWIRMFNLDKTLMNKAENAVLKPFPLHAILGAKTQPLSEVENLLHHIDCQQNLFSCAFAISR